MRKLQLILVFLICLACTLALGFVVGKSYNKSLFDSKTQSSSAPEIKPKPLSVYEIENLAKNPIQPGKLTIKESIADNAKFSSFVFEFRFNPNLDGKTLKMSTGQINIPKEGNSLPVIIMLRGYADQQLYTTGLGTRNAAAFFAENGFVTVAPDFLGYADSDVEAGDVLETRFQTYTLTLSLLQSLGQIAKWDNKNTLFWGHSNGGQIALTVLEISGKPIPTTLWAPVSKPFPYSVLYYTDESDDGGKFLRKQIAIFEEDYNADKYSIHKYYDRIQAPIQLHQGSKDDAVPLDWSTDLANILKIEGVDITYNTYPGADHNLVPFWDTVVAKDLEFFTEFLD